MHDLSNTDTLAQRLKQALSRAGISASACAREVGVKPSFIYDILGGKSTNPSPVKLAKIAALVNVSLTDLIGLDGEEIPASPPSSYVSITHILTAETQAGKTVITEDELAEPYYFRRSWISERLDTEPENLRLVFVEGDMMEPTLYHGDMVMVDITRKRPSPPGMFVLFDGMGIVIKRLEFLPQSTPPALRLTADNSQYALYERPLEGTELIGRVVWFAREV